MLLEGFAYRRHFAEVTPQVLVRPIQKSGTSIGRYDADKAIQGNLNKNDQVGAAVAIYAPPLAILFGTEF